MQNLVYSTDQDDEASEKDLDLISEEEKYQKAQERVKHIFEGRALPEVISEDEMNEMGLSVDSESELEVPLFDLEEFCEKHNIETDIPSREERMEELLDRYDDPDLEGWAGTTDAAESKLNLEASFYIAKKKLDPNSRFDVNRPFNDVDLQAELEARNNATPEEERSFGELGDIFEETVVPEGILSFDDDQDALKVNASSEATFWNEKTAEINERKLSGLIL